MLKKGIEILARNLIFFLCDGHLSIISKFRLKVAPRFKQLSIKLFGKKFIITDAAGFVRNYEEIFIDHTYNFKSEKRDVVILDCGANVGLSVIYFKKVYPDAKVIAFEPDPYLFGVLTKNITEFMLKDVTLVESAVWINNDELIFHSNKGFSGAIDHTLVGSHSQSIKVKAIRLKEYFDMEIDMLKMDIEGAEINVIEDCKDDLGKVGNMFIEYHCNEVQELDRLLRILTRSSFVYTVKEEFVKNTSPLMISNPNQISLQVGIHALRLQ